MNFDVVDLGLIRYEEAYEIQCRTLEEVRLKNRPSTLILAEHFPVVTLGATYKEENLRLSREEFAQQGIEVVRTDRGGDVTYHAPGQLVAYPVVDLSLFGHDLHRWLRSLEEVVIQTLGHWSIQGTRNPVNTGVWVGNKKVCAIGIKVRRWVSMHGLALNCNIDLAGFETIVPCGIRGDYGVTSLSAEGKLDVSTAHAKTALIESFRRHSTD
jgi:lipoyl(octanoyl) transferase